MPSRITKKTEVVDGDMQSEDKVVAMDSNEQDTSENADGIF